MTDKYRKKWTETIVKFNEIKDKNELATSEELFNLIQNYVILTKLAYEEINENEPFEEQVHSIKKCGLDCSDLIFQTLIMFSIKQININEIHEFIKKTESLTDEEKLELVKD